MNKCKKVFIIGAHGLGKTWMVNNIYEKVISKGNLILRVDEQAGDWMNKFSFYDSSSPQYTEFQLALFHYHIFAFLSPVNLIADRSVLDVMAYAKVYCPLAISHYMKDHFRQYLKEFKEHSVYFYRECASLLREDQVPIQTTLEVLLKKYDIKVIDEIGRSSAGYHVENIVDYFLE